MYIDVGRLLLCLITYCYRGKNSGKPSYYYISLVVFMFFEFVLSAQ